VIDATSLDRLQIVASNIAGQVAGSWTAQGNQLMFTPLNDYPSDTRISVYLYGLLDLAGNELNSSTYFQSAPATDTTAPQVIAMTPGNGAMDIGPQTSIALTFSESLRQNTLNSNNFVLYVEGDIIRPSVSYTADNRTVILNTPLPSAKSVSVIVTSDVMDNAGNRLLDYAATFNTALIMSFS
jgi:hypothetical protein